MRLSIPLVIIILSLFLSGCFHAPAQPPVPPISDNQNAEWQVPEELAVYDIARITSTEPVFPLDKPLDTSDWNVYRDEQCGFEIRYPKSTKDEVWWTSFQTSTLTDECHKGGINYSPKYINNNDSLEYIQKTYEVPSKFVGSVYISRLRKKYIFENAGSKSLKFEVWRNFFNPDLSTTGRSGVFAGRKARLVYDNDDPTIAFLTIYIEKSDYIYSLNGYIHSLDADYNSILKFKPEQVTKIFHTFQFLDDK